MSRSTGPISVAGKARSAQNARKYGLRAVKTIAAEDVDAFKALVRDLEREYGPGDAMLSLTIERVAMDMMRLRGGYERENAMFAQARIQHVEAKRAREAKYKWVPDELLQDYAVPPLDAWRLMGRYQTELSGKVSRGLGELMALSERARRGAGASRAVPRSDAHALKQAASVQGTHAKSWDAHPDRYGALPGKWLTPDQAREASELLASLRADVRPRTATEHILVERLVMATTKYRRTYTVEKACDKVARLHTKRMHERGHERFAGMDLELAQDSAGPDVQLSGMLMQYGGALDREISRTMGELNYIQDAAAAATQQMKSPKRLAAVPPL